MNSVRAMARALGRRGGRARARRLPAEKRRQIAALGGAARRASLEAARRIAENYSYLAAAKALEPHRPRPVRVSACAGPLPGLYPRRD
jgi:formylglycine-generating enzyme required for sulfatase activity